MRICWCLVICGFIFFFAVGILQSPLTLVCWWAVLILYFCLLIGVVLAGLNLFRYCLLSVVLSVLSDCACQFWLFYWLCFFLLEFILFAWCVPCEFECAVFVVLMCSMGLRAFTDVCPGVDFLRSCCFDVLISVAFVVFMFHGYRSCLTCGLLLFGLR